ncbi:kelch repeat-containing protein [Myroides profundi]|uniref:kelch repeat-containing protein n=1 Tax=Myroides profundi TaxID=480520 RepID=UPI0005A4633B|nr:kelch repeat-containing protein [Myroides profundi]
MDKYLRAGFKSESQPGKTGEPGKPGEAGGPGEGVTIVHNDSGVWVYDPTTNTWTNILGQASSPSHNQVRQANQVNQVKLAAQAKA